MLQGSKLLALPGDPCRHFLAAGLHGLEALGGPSLVGSGPHVSTATADLGEASRPEGHWVSSPEAGLPPGVASS